MGALGEDDIFRAVERTHLRVEGSYSVVCLITGWGMVAFRDPNGIRPLFLGKRESDNFTERLVSSESVVCQSIGFEMDRDVSPGEAVIVRMDGRIVAAMDSIPLSGPRVVRPYRNKHCTALDYSHHSLHHLAV